MMNEEPSQALTLSCGGRLLSLSRPAVMGIVNCTPDSFYAPSRTPSGEPLRARVRQVLQEGACLVDVGACSTRPGAQSVSAEEEMRRLRQALPLVMDEVEAFRRAQPASPAAEHTAPPQDTPPAGQASSLAPYALRSPSCIMHHASCITHAACHEAARPIAVSVDTFRADVAQMCVEELGVDIVNDISGLERDAQMARTLARLCRHRSVPYVLTYAGPGAQSEAQSADPVQEAVRTLAQGALRLADMGVADVVLDPGFGFWGTMADNYRLMAHLSSLAHLGHALLVGVSRKRMVWQLLGQTPSEALPGTTALHTAALLQGAHILRVHDVAAAVDVCRVVQALQASGSGSTQREEDLRFGR